MFSDENATRLWKNGYEWIIQNITHRWQQHFASFWQRSNSIRVEVLIFWRYPRVQLFWDVFIWVGWLISEAMSHQTGQVKTSELNIWVMYRVGKHFRFEWFNVSLQGWRTRWGRPLSCCRLTLSASARIAADFPKVLGSIPWIELDTVLQSWFRSASTAEDI